MAGLFFLISILGLGLMVYAIISLVSPFVGWKHHYKASVTETVADIPKPGRYAINVRRHRAWMIQGFGTLADTFPQVNFSVEHKRTGRAVPYTSQRSMMTSHSGMQVTMPVGYFDIDEPGNYTITSLPESKFLENEEIVIRRHVAFGKFFAAIWGIIIGMMMLISGLLFGFLFLAGVFAGI
ncbi:MAG: hypothetical protein FWD03_00695 [Defluviitaleaceae bacterium]|nr:hypothetical protein [Defluviitaleaceae bacterium]